MEGYLNLCVIFARGIDARGIGRPTATWKIYCEDETANIPIP